MSDDPLKVRRDGGILEVTLDRPKANAIDLKTSIQMGEVFQEFRDDPELRVAIVTGGGEKFFCAGWDLKAAADGDGVRVGAILFFLTLFIICTPVFALAGALFSEGNFHRKCMTND